MIASARVQATVIDFEVNSPVAIWFYLARRGCEPPFAVLVVIVGTSERFAECSSCDCDRILSNIARHSPELDSRSHEARDQYGHPDDHEEEQGTHARRCGR